MSAAFARLALVLTLSACHNDAAEFARGLAAQVGDTAICWDVSEGHRAYGDVAVCRVGTESWLCTSEPLKCSVLGADVKLQRG